MTDLSILHHDECQLLDWGESRSGGPWIKLRLKDAEYLDVFRSMDTATMKKTGHVLNVTIAQGDIEVIAEEQKNLFGKEANFLHKSSFFRRPDVWKKVGTDDQFLAWIRQQPCAYSNQPGPCEAAHVRRVANGSGMGIKPEYSAIPLKSQHHQMQHQQGEGVLGGKDWFDKQRIEHLHRWAWETLKTTLGYAHWNQVPPSALINWARENGVDMHLPPGYREEVQ